MPKMLPLLAGLLSLTACGTAAPMSEPTAAPSANPCAFLPLPVLLQADRDALASEMQAAPSNAVWPMQIGGYLRLRAAVRACRSVGR